jgi:octaprenyl-diphosphate synthase
VLRELAKTPHDHLAEILEQEMALVDKLIRERMVSQNAPRIPDITTHLVNAGGKKNFAHC